MKEQNNRRKHILSVTCVNTFIYDDKLFNIFILNSGLNANQLECRNKKIIVLVLGAFIYQTMTLASTLFTDEV